MPCLHFIHTEKFTEILSKVYFSLQFSKLKDSLPYVKLLVDKQRNVYILLLFINFIIQSYFISYKKAVLKFYINKTL